MSFYVSYKCVRLILLKRGLFRSKSEKQIVKESERNRKILETAFRIFVERKIEPVSMGEIAEAARKSAGQVFFGITRINWSL